eukprot:4147978-Pyramimonas_sp.AAC.1
MCPGMQAPSAELWSVRCTLAQRRCGEGAPILAGGPLGASGPSRGLLPRPLRLQLLSGGVGA